MAGFYCIKKKTHDMTDEDCIQEVLVSRTKEGNPTLCSLCRVKGRIGRDRPDLVKEVISQLLGEKEATDLFRKDTPPVKAIRKQ